MAKPLGLLGDVAVLRLSHAALARLGRADRRASAPRSSVERGELKQGAGRDAIFDLPQGRCVARDSLRLVAPPGAHTLSGRCPIPRRRRSTQRCGALVLPWRIAPAIARWGSRWRWPERWRSPTTTRHSSGSCPWSLPETPATSINLFSSRWLAPTAFAPSSEWSWSSRLGWHLPRSSAGSRKRWALPLGRHRPPSFWAGESTLDSSPMLTASRWLGAGGSY